MQANGANLNITDLAQLAVDSGIKLGTNPVRTILYYRHLGLLSPKTIREGSVRRAYYTEDALIALRVIQELKARGLTLQQIKVWLQSHVFLSKQGREFVEQFRTELPKAEFPEGYPITGTQLAFLVDKAMTVFDEVHAARFLWRLFSGQDEVDLDLDTIAASLQSADD